MFFGMIRDRASLQWRQMCDLPANLVVGLAHRAKRSLAARRNRQEHLLDWHLAGDMPGDLAAENGTGSDAAPVEADERDHVLGRRVQTRQMVARRADPAVPLVLERDVAELGEEGLETPSRPAAVNGMAGVAQRSDAVDDEASGRVGTVKVASVFGKAGRANTATDPAPIGFVSEADISIDDHSGNPASQSASAKFLRSWGRWNGSHS
jgi:hypothetical protein